MSDWWRDTATEMLPEMAELAADPEETIFLFLSEVLEMAHSALRRNDEKEAARYFEFARLCLFNERDEATWQAAGVCFYEYAFDDEALACKVAPYIDAEIFPKIAGLLRFRLGEKRYAKVEQVVNERHRQS